MTVGEPRPSCRPKPRGRRAGVPGRTPRAGLRPCHWSLMPHSKTRSSTSATIPTAATTTVINAGSGPLVAGSGCRGCAPACVESGRCSHGADEPPDAAGAPAGRGGQVGRAPMRPGVPVGARPEPTPPIGSVKRPARSATLANGIGSTFAPSEDSPVSSRVNAISRGRETRPRSSERSATTSRRSCEDPSGSPPAAGTFLRNDDGRGKLRGYGGGRRGHGRPATRR
jgi:hypothetical protein